MKFCMKGTLGRASSTRVPLLLQRASIRRYRVFQVFTKFSAKSVTRDGVGPSRNDPPHTVSSTNFAYRSQFARNKLFKLRHEVTLPPNHVDREKLTIRHMITLYCHANGHSQSGLCSRCSEVVHYAFARIEACSYLPGKKPACGLCRSNCFEANQRRQFAQIMREMGLRMLMQHPLLTLAHLRDAIRNRPR